MFTRARLLQGPIFLLTLLPGAMAAEKPLSEAEVIRLGKAATALAEGNKARGPGAAFCVHSSGLFVTGAHLAEPAPIQLVLYPGLDGQKAVEARAVLSNREMGLALLRAEGVNNLPALDLGTCDHLTELTGLFAFGFLNPPSPRDHIGFPPVDVRAGSITSLLRKAQVKNNLAPFPPSLACAVATQPTGPPTLSWLGPTTWTADQLLAGAAPPAASARDQACEFITAFLESGARTSRDIWAAAQEQGLATRTLERAKSKLEVRSMCVRVDGRLLWYWLLPGQQLPSSIPPEAAPPDLEPWLAPLREKYPPSTPLDEL